MLDGVGYTLSDPPLIRFPSTPLVSFASVPLGEFKSISTSFPGPEICDAGRLTPGDGERVSLPVGGALPLSLFSEPDMSVGGSLDNVKPAYAADGKSTRLPTDSGVVDFLDLAVPNT